MHAIERTFDGLQAVYRSRGVARLGNAAFLGLWLLFWIVGEVAVLSVLGWGAWSLVTGRPLSDDGQPVSPGAAVGTGLFLTVWLSIWTLGGIAAGTEFLRLLFGKVRLIARPEGFEWVRSYGLFHRRRTFPRESLIRFYTSASGKGLVLETAQGSHDLIHLTTQGDWPEAARLFNAEYRLSDNPPEHGTVLENWVETTAPEGDIIWLENPSARHTSARVLVGIAVLLGLLAAWLLGASWQNLSVLPFAIILAIVAGFAWRGGRILSSRRDEWTRADGELILRRRENGRLAPLFTARALEFREESDSDGDSFFSLFAIRDLEGESSGPVAPRQASLEKKIATKSGASDPVLGFGRRLSTLCSIPLIDKTTPSAKAEARQRQLDTLAASGKLGAWLARRLR